MTYTAVFVSQGGHLIGIDGYRYKFNGINNVASILEYDYKNKVTLMMKDGNIKKVMLADLHPERCEEIPGALFSQDYNIRIYTYCGFITITYENERFRNLTIFSQIMETVEEATLSDVYEHGIKIKFKDGSVDDFEILVHSKNEMYFVNEKRKINISPSDDVYCIAGKMNGVAIERIWLDRANREFNIYTVGGRSYGFDISNFVSISYLEGRLFTLGNYLIYIFEDDINKPIIHILGEPLVKGIECSVIRHPDINDNDNSMAISLLAANAEYYVDAECNIISLKENWTFPIKFKKYEGKYYDEYNQPLNVITGKFPLANCVSFYINSLVKYAQTFVLNYKFMITAPILQEIEDIKIIHSFDPFNLLITRKNGETMRASLVVFGDTFKFVFENGVVENAWQQPGEYYSTMGKYTLIPQTEYESITKEIYNIRGNVVWFSAGFPADKIYEIFGYYLLFDQFGAKYVGTIIINRTQLKTKPAASSSSD